MTASFRPGQNVSQDTDQVRAHGLVPDQVQAHGLVPDQWRAKGGPIFANKGYKSSRPKFAAGGPVLGRTRDFLKTPDEFTGGRLPPKQSAPVKQDYGSKGAPAKRSGDKSEPPVKPRK